MKVNIIGQGESVCECGGGRDEERGEVIKKVMGKEYYSRKSSKCLGFKLGRCLGCWRNSEGDRKF